MTEIIHEYLETIGPSNVLSFFLLALLFQIINIISRALNPINMS